MDFITLSMEPQFQKAIQQPVQVLLMLHLEVKNKLFCHFFEANLGWSSKVNALNWDLYSHVGEEDLFLII